MVTLDELQEMAETDPGSLDRLLLPIQSAVAQWPDVKVSQDIAYFIKKGQAVLVPHAPSQGYVKLYSGETQFMGIGHILEDGRVAPRRLMNL
ncbi:MAG TPA: tRNA pseudouridine(55) synthase TruB, partial [Gammaproteobacteria bacterium]